MNLGTENAVVNEGGEQEWEPPFQWGDFIVSSNLLTILCDTNGNSVSCYSKKEKKVKLILVFSKMFNPKEISFVFIPTPVL